MRDHAQQADALPRAPRFAQRWRDVLEYADAIEMPLVRSLVGMTRFRVVRGVILAVNLLGNGWVYLAILGALYMSGSPKAWPIAGAAFAAVAGSHAIYAIVKRMIARLRPFERDPSMLPLARALDRYSFPSGHCTTFTAVLVPIVCAAPVFWPYALIALAVLSWCRIAAAHHYPSDVVAGICLGIAVAIPFTNLMVPA
jgi:undecaprenyl-diphosphatase